MNIIAPGPWSLLPAGPSFGFARPRAKTVLIVLKQGIKLIPCNNRFQKTIKIIIVL